MDRTPMPYPLRRDTQQRAVWPAGLTHLDHKLQAPLGCQRCPDVSHCAERRSCQYSGHSQALRLQRGEPC